MNQAEVNVDLPAPRREQSAPRSAIWIARVCARATDLGLLAIIFLAPFFFGGRHDLGRLVLVLLVAGTACCWFVRQTILPNARWTRSVANALILAGAILLLAAARPPTELLD